MFYVWFDDLNLWRKHVFTRAQPAVEDSLPAQPTSPHPEPGVLTRRPVQDSPAAPDLLDFFTGKRAGGQGLLAGLVRRERK